MFWKGITHVNTMAKTRLIDTPKAVIPIVFKTRQQSQKKSRGLRNSGYILPVNHLYYFAR